MSAVRRKKRQRAQTHSPLKSSCLMPCASSHAAPCFHMLSFLSSDADSARHTSLALAHGAAIFPEGAKPDGRPDLGLFGHSPSKKQLAMSDSEKSSAHESESEPESEPSSRSEYDEVRSCGDILVVAILFSHPTLRYSGDRRGVGTFWQAKILESPCWRIHYQVRIPSRPRLFSVYDRRLGNQDREAQEGKCGAQEGK